jgi:AcrR family transcriptional regulator
MGRPREHDDRTREALRSAAERMFEAHGATGVSVRAVAEAVGTTTRAVYSLFGSRESLLVDAMGVRAYGLLSQGLDEQQESGDPAADLVDASITVFRRMVLEHPELFRIAFQRVLPEFEPGPEVVAARREALDRLTRKVGRLVDAGLLDQGSLTNAVITFQAMCEGLGNLELRGAIMRLLPAGHEEEAWRTAMTATVAGLVAPASGGPGRMEP